MKIALETVELVSAGWVTHDVVVSGSSEETVRIGTAALVSAPELGTSEGVVSGPLLKMDGVVIGTVVLVSSPGLMVKEAVIFGLSGVVMIVPIVLVLAFLSDVLRRGSIPEVGVDTLVVTVTVGFRAVAVVSVLSVPPVDNPVRLADVGAWGVWMVVPPWAALLGIFVICFTMSSVLVDCVECGIT